MSYNLENEILNILKEVQSASIDDLAEKLFVSPSTVRRRLEELQNKGLVTRTHGGAKINGERSFFPAFTFRTHQNSVEKAHIALSAVKLIKNGNIIFLDGSTSAFFIAKYLADFKNIKVITNGIDTLSLLSANGTAAYSTGGFISPVNRAVLVGHYAEETIEKFHADIAFISAQSVSKNGEIYDCFEEENFLRNCMRKHSNKNVFLCDSSKFGRTSQYHLCSINAFDYIISDRDISNYFSTDNLPEIIF